MRSEGLVRILFFSLKTRGGRGRSRHRRWAPKPHQVVVNSSSSGDSGGGANCDQENGLVSMVIERMWLGGEEGVNRYRWRWSTFDKDKLGVTFFYD